MFLERIALSCVIAFISSSIAHAEVDEVNEPKQAAQIEIDGKLVPVSFDRSTDIEINGKSVPLTLKQSNEREFNVQHLSFRYPEYFDFAASFRDGTNEPVRWDLEGHDVDVMVFRASAEELRHADDNHPFDGWVYKAFGEKNFVRENSVAIDIRALRLEGTRYKVPIKGGELAVDLLLDVYEVPGKFGNVRYFLLLWGLDGENPEEELLVKKLLDQSFTIREEPLSHEWRARYGAKMHEN